MVGDDRSGPGSRLSPFGASEVIAVGATQTASFAVGALRLDLSAAPGAARLVVATEQDRDVYVVEPAALSAWADATKRLLALEPAATATDLAEYRAPFLVDREGRPSIAFEGLVTDHGVTYRLLVTGESSRIAGLMTTADVVRDVSEAATGAVLVARTSPT